MDAQVERARLLPWRLVCGLFGNIAASMEKLKRMNYNL